MSVPPASLFERVCVCVALICLLRTLFNILGESVSYLTGNIILAIFQLKLLQSMTLSEVLQIALHVQLSLEWNNLMELLRAKEINDQVLRGKLSTHLPLTTDLVQ